LEATLRIENRSQLIYLLTEAAELEHGIMCCYLFAAFSMKNSTAEGVTEDQLRGIRRWRRLILGIAVEEMLHLGAACNLLTAVGGAPQLRRPNLPVHPRAYPSGFQLQLAQFNADTIDQFVAVEEPDVIGQVNGQPVRRQLPTLVRQRLSDIFASEREFHTQGRLYRGIEDGLVYLAQKYGEDHLFIGHPDVQTAAPSHFRGLKDLKPVTDLASALEAIQVIVEQGEGASRETPDSHYSKFVQIRDELAQALSEDPAFQPARPVVVNPYALPPSDKTDLTGLSIIDDADTAEMCNLCDGCYELMVQMLGRLFVHAEETEAECRRLSAAAELMMTDVFAPLADALTMLPAGPSHPGKTAGPSFRLSRGASIPTHREAAWAVFCERLGELDAYCSFLESRENAPPVLARVKRTLTQIAASLELDPG
jgi:hypothetical protein